MHEKVAAFLLESFDTCYELLYELVPVAETPIIVTHCQYIAQPAQNTRHPPDTAPDTAHAADCADDLVLT